MPVGALGAGSASSAAAVGQELTRMAWVAVLAHPPIRNHEDLSGIQLSFIERLLCGRPGKGMYDAERQVPCLEEQPGSVNEAG